MRTTRAWRALVAVLLPAGCLACGASPGGQRGTAPASTASDEAHVQAKAGLPADASEPGAPTPTGVHLHFDFAARRVWVVSARGRIEASLADDAGETRLREFRQQLASDTAAPWSPATQQLARALGRALLQPIADQLRDVRAWEVSPLDVAPLGALIAPWSASDQPLQATTVIWYSAQTVPPLELRAPPIPSECLPSPQQRARMPRNDGILSVAPFIPGAVAAGDDPDTTLVVMRRTARNVELIPRNDTGAEAIEGALRERRYALTWLRARPAQASALLPALDRGPLLLWWSLAGPVAVPPESLQSVAREWLTGPKGIALDLWPRGQHAAEVGTAAFLEALRGGSDAASALHAGTEALRGGGAPAAQWAGWVYVGNPALTAQLQAPGWLQRGGR